MVYNPRSRLAKSKKAKTELTKQDKLNQEKQIAELKEVSAKILENQQQPELEKPAPASIITWSDVQKEFLSATEKEVLFSGGRGSGKSDALLADPLRYCSIPRFRGLILRRTMPELRDLIGRAKILYNQVYPGVKWKEQDKIFTFPSGARIEFGYCDNEDDLMRYHGQEFTWLGIDEITHFPTEDIITRLMASLRSTDISIPIHIRAATNPGGPGARWVKERFIDLGPSSTRIQVNDQYGNPIDGLTRRWIHSTAWDNKPLLDANPDYVKMLQSLSGVQRAQWYEGSWDAMSGAAFPEFRRDVHVIEPFKISNNWYKFRACDWGFTQPACCLWFAVDFDHTIYVYRELYVTNTYADEFARTISALEQDDYIRYGVIDGSVADQRGHYTTIEDQMGDEGVYWDHADKSKGSRIAGKQVLHKYLRVDPDTQKPKLFIFNSCKNLVKELSSIVLDNRNLEDVDTTQPDHAYDALRYGLMSRPSPVFENDFMSQMQTKVRNTPTIINSTFGY